MAVFNLLPHAHHPPRLVKGVSVNVARTPEGGLWLEYGVNGAATLKLPKGRQPARADDLWRTTCFELFLMFDNQEHYVEFNFSPSTQWAAYGFDGHREGRTVLDIDPPEIERRPDGIAVTCNLAAFPRGAHRMGLSAVIEEEGGVLSYWALAHPPGAPDFHHPACFAATLPPPAAR